MEDEGNSTESPEFLTPIPVVVKNFADFHRDLSKQLAAACIVAAATGLVTIGMNVLDEKRKARKARKEAEKTQLKPVK